MQTLLAPPHPTGPAPTEAGASMLPTGVTCAAEAAGGYDTAGPMECLELVAREYHDLVERLLDAWIATVDWGGLGPLTGLPGEAWFHLQAQLPPQLSSQIRRVADRLPVLPAMRTAFRDGAITFHQLATFVTITKDCNGPVLQRLDRETAIRARDYHADGMDPDQLGWDTQALVDDLRAAGWAQRQERRRVHGSELRLQGDLDGGVFLAGSFTPEDAAPVVTMLEAASGTPDPELTRAQQRAKTLRDVAEHVLGDDCDAAPARPTMTLLVDLTTATPDRFAHLLSMSTARRAPTLSARAADVIAESAELRLVLAEGRNPLAELKATDIPAPVRRTVLTLHGECSMPACHRPAWQCDLNHLTPRKLGGGHQPSNLAPLCRSDHTRFHAADAWTATKDPSTGKVTYTHQPTGRHYSSLPASSRPKPWTTPDWRTATSLAPPAPTDPPERPPDDVDPPPTLFP